jgi:hypothetical protein
MSMLSVPLKTVVAWYCDAASGYTPPPSWAIADGTTYSSVNQDVVPGSSWTTPDLRNRFILGASLSKGDGVAGVAVTDPNVDLAAGAPGPKGVGGANSLDTTLDQSQVKGGTDDTIANDVQTDIENRPRYYGLVYIIKIKY